MMQRRVARSNGGDQEIGLHSAKMKKLSLPTAAPSGEKRGDWRGARRPVRSQKTGERADKGRERKGKERGDREERGEWRE